MIEAAYLWVLLGGFLGGVVRGLVGYIKHQFKFKNVPFKPLYFSGMMFLSGVIGLLTAIAVKEAGVSALGVDVITPGIAFIIGYAGGDFIENIYKILFKKTSIFPNPLDIVN
jgi:fluoride ion exporter CrcB/FEX